MGPENFNETTLGGRGLSARLKSFMSSTLVTARGRGKSFSVAIFKVICLTDAGMWKTPGSSLGRNR